MSRPQTLVRHRLPLACCVQNLISLKLELALCCEREVIGRHELYKSRETNLKLASKMTKLEVNAYANKK